MIISWGSNLDASQYLDSGFALHWASVEAIVLPPIPLPPTLNERAMITKRVRDAIVRRLRDPISGLNPNLQTVCEAYSIPELQIDFDSRTQFFQGWISPDNLEDTTVFKYPALILYTVNSQDDRVIKYKQFSGVVQVGIEVHMELIQKYAIQDMESYQDAIEGAMVLTLHGAEYDSEFSSFGAHFRRDTAFQRNPVQLESGNWRISMTIGMSFEVHQ